MAGSIYSVSVMRSPIWWSVTTDQEFFCSNTRGSAEGMCTNRRYKCTGGQDTFVTWVKVMGFFDNFPTKLKYINSKSIQNNQLEPYSQALLYKYKFYNKLCIHDLYIVKYS